MSVQCADPVICAGVKNKTLYTFKKDEKHKKKRIEVFSILKVIEMIQADFPEVEVVSYGEQDLTRRIMLPAHSNMSTREKPVRPGSRTTGCTMAVVALSH